MTHDQPTAPDERRFAPIPCFVNVSSGSGREVFDVVERDARFEVRTCEPDEIRAAVEDAIRSGAHRIAVAGGDGTLATAAGALIGSDVELAVVPAGTRDHFARSLMLPLGTAEALNVAAGVRTRAVDAGFVNDRLFLNTSSVGAYVDFVHERERSRRRFGYHLASLLAAAQIVSEPRSLSVGLTFEGEHRRFRTPLVFLRLREREEYEEKEERDEKEEDAGEEEKDPNNYGAPAGDHGVRTGRQGPARAEVRGTDSDVQGGHSTANTGASPVFRLAVVRGRTRIRLTALALTTAVRGLDVAARTPHLKTFFVDNCTIEVQTPETFVAVDGETIRMSTPLTYRVERDALQVLVP